MNDNKRQVLQQISESNMLALQNGQRADSATDKFASLAQQLNNTAIQLSQSGLAEAASLVSSAVERLNQLPSEIAEIISQADKTEEVLQELRNVTDAVESIKLDPTINVSSPEVNIPSLNLKPLQDAIKELQGDIKKTIDLDDYKAQNLADEDTFQYVGYVSPSGGWYIIENDISGGSLRYHFGKSNYASSWDKHNGLSYKLLNEAIDAIQA